MEVGEDRDMKPAKYHSQYTKAKIIFLAAIQALPLCFLIVIPLTTHEPLHDPVFDSKLIPSNTKICIYICIQGCLEYTLKNDSILSQLQPTYVVYIYRHNTYNFKDLRIGFIFHSKFAFYAQVATPNTLLSSQTLLSAHCSLTFLLHPRSLLPLKQSSRPPLASTVNL